VLLCVGEINCELLGGGGGSGVEWCGLVVCWVGSMLGWSCGGVVWSKCSLWLVE
jgi:hypothetical protein